MTTISWNGGPILKNGAIGTEAGCCCKTTKFCTTKCSGAGLPIELLFSVKTFSYSGSIVFDPIGDYIITLNTTSCDQYSGSFFPHTFPGPTPCFPPLCFTSCSHKLLVGMFLGSGGGVSVTVADYTSGGADTGGTAVNGTDHQADICSGSFPITGSITIPQYCVSFTMDYELSLP